MVYLAIAVIVIILLVLGLSLLNSILVLLGFNFYYFLENLVAIDTRISPVIPWTILGATVGACVGLWRAAGKNRIGYLKPVALIVPILLVTAFATFTKPLDHHSEHPVETYYMERAQAKADLRSKAAEEQARKERIRYVIARNGANVRHGPSTGYAKSDALPRGAEVLIVSEENGWYKVEYNSRNVRKVGFIHGSLLGSGR